MRIASWLVHKLKSDPDQSVVFSELYSQYEQSANEDGQRLVDKKHISKYLKGVFPLSYNGRKRPATIPGKVETVFHGIAWKDNEPSNNLIFDKHVLINTLSSRYSLMHSDHEVRVTLPTSDLSNYNRVVKEITFSSNLTWKLEIGITEIDLDALEIDNTFSCIESDVLDILYVVNRLRICRGRNPQKDDAINTQYQIQNEWTCQGDEKSREIRISSKSCKRVVPFAFQLLCTKCRHMVIGTGVPHAPNCNSSKMAKSRLEITPKISRGLLGVVNKCSSFMTSDNRSYCIPFMVDNKLVGILSPSVVKKLKNFPNVFVSIQPMDKNEEIHMSYALKNCDERSEAIAGVLETLRDEDAFPTLRGWRNELYNVKENFSSEILFTIERSAACLLGVAQYGVHVNGYTVDAKGVMRMWIARRSPHKQTWPGKLDNLCAGGLASGLGVRECLIKECREEANIPKDLLECLKAVGCLSYIFENELGIHPETQFTYDLLVPESFEPQNVDGEVEGFQLMTLNDVLQKIVMDEFKPNCAMVVLDFLIRHGYVNADNEPHFCSLVEKMHYPLQNMLPLF